ncbi:hypothetical protein KEM56_005400 [Ascosphaera pollenicola]|nr:hypothetical protein KEM56_005400 [Ascosphaera pollenicola]
MTLAFFVLASLDLLGVLETSVVSPTERHQYIDWIYSCQLETGGFRGFPGTDFSHEVPRSEANAVWDPANVPATFFALVALLLLKDDLSRVRRTECLRWLKTLQRPDGSFGEVLGANGRIEGAVDLRFCCCAAGVRYILRGKDEAYLRDVEDIDVNSLERYVVNCQAYDGGFSSSPSNESHAGLTYCAIGTLHFLNKVSTESSKGGLAAPLSEGNPRFECLIEWLAHRQTNDLENCEESENSSESGEVPTSTEIEDSSSPSSTSSPQLAKDDRVRSLPHIPIASELR